MRENFFSVIFSARNIINSNDFGNVLVSALVFQECNTRKSITNIHLPNNSPHHVPPNQHLFTHREPFRRFRRLSIFLSQVSNFFLSIQWDERKKTWRGKRGKNIPLTQEIGTSCATAQCNHLPHLSISCLFHLIQQVLKSWVLCFPVDH